MTRSVEGNDLPLEGLRVVELNDGKLETCARVLADLGADVILVEPPHGLRSRAFPPLHGDVSLYFATHNANKRSVVLDLQQAEDRDRFIQLLGTADLLIETTKPGTLDALDLSVAALQSRWPLLCVVSISDFGQSGPYRDYIASNEVHSAMAGVLCRSGRPGEVPLQPPGSLAWESAALQAAWVALLGVWQRFQTGRGDHLDVSVYETVAQVVDPALGVTGSAAAGTSALDTTPRGRPAAQPLYPIIPCRNGQVRTCVLNPRQWAAMSEWLGSDHPFTDPQYSHIGKRLAVADKVNAHIALLFSRYDVTDLVAEGQRRGVPIAAVASPGDALEDSHFLAREAFMRFEVSPGVVGRVPSGFFEVDGQRMGLRAAAPALGEHTDAVLDSLGGVPAAADAARGAVEPRRPLEGLRVLDLGVIVAGAEAGRLFADQGAEVIKVENRAFADGGRQSQTGDPMTTSIAVGHRNKLSIGINLKSEKGRELFKQLAARSDVVLSNFKPGTLESLGLGYDVLSQINPRIIMMDSSALGRTGPRSRSLGYGPLVRATTGQSWLWRYPGIENSISDGVTIYPDHLAGRVAAIGVMSLLLRRMRSRRGGTVSVSQAEIFLNSNSEHFLRESLQPGSFVARGNASEFHCPGNVYPCAGDDEWCAITVRDDEEWRRLACAIGREDLLADSALAVAEGRVARRAEIDAYVSAWTSGRSPREVTRELQQAGVPAGFMQRLSEYRTDPHLTSRGFIGTLMHPGLRAPLPTETSPALSQSMPVPECRPAPYQGEHTREVIARLLALSEVEIESLIASGDLEEMTTTNA